MTQSDDWIIVHDGTQPGHKPYEMECLRCGKTVSLSLPVQVHIWLATAKAFKKSHKHCRDKNE